MSEQTKKWRYGVKRWIVLALFIVGGYAAFGRNTMLRPISPVVVLPAEPISPNSPITNTMLATLIADVVLLLFAFGAYRFHKQGNLVPNGLYNFFETIIEFLWNTVEGATGKWAKRIFPVVATIFLLIFFANVIKLFPGFESIGWMKEAHKAPAYAPVKLFDLGGLPVYTIDKGRPVEVEAHGEEATAAAGAESEHGEAKTEPCHACEVVPFLRGSATDLNFTIALAIIAVVMTQVYGVWALGPSYFSKFFQFGALVNGGIFGLINFGVGFLELILEFAKILSFSFRLFGNIFAGTLLLSIVGALLPIVIPPGLYLFEIFFGIIQAYVFFLLATMFISMALVSHHGDGHGEEHH
ncbi:MAG: FoF1 ATP synthase subunit a [Anaerolineales bacterium]|nr:FoF1 ATP synthase subunit a [Anaerolineales bacterium]